MTSQSLGLLMPGGSTTQQAMSSYCWDFTGSGTPHGGWGRQGQMARGSTQPHMLWVSSRTSPAPPPGRQSRLARTPPFLSISLQSPFSLGSVSLDDGGREREWIGPTIHTQLVGCVSHLFFAIAFISGPCNPRKNLVPCRTPIQTPCLSISTLSFASSLSLSTMTHERGRGRAP